jgi:hypothetical protein
MAKAGAGTTFEVSGWYVLIALVVIGVLLKGFDFNKLFE